MHPFALSRADDTAKAIAAHAFDPQLAFVPAALTYRLMKDRAPFRASFGHQWLAEHGADRSAAEGGVRIGALARMSDVAADTEVRRRFPVVAEALLFAASANCAYGVDRRNIMQRTRCAYSATRLVAAATSGTGAPAVRPPRP